MSGLGAWIWGTSQLDDAIGRFRFIFKYKVGLIGFTQRQGNLGAVAIWVGRYRTQP